MLVVHLLRKAWSAVVGAVRPGRSREEWDALAAEKDFDRKRARTMELESFLFVSPSAREALQRGSESILSDAFEALVGAVYRDGGISAARKFVYEHLLSPEQVLSRAMSDDNYKSALLELSQRHARGVPRYETVGEEGPDHDRRFTVRVYLGAHCLGQGAGRSKKEAEQAAAFQGFRRLQQELAPHTKTQQP